MNTKKITALALAALMAAGSTATSFAVNNVVDAGNDLSNDRPLTFKDMNIYEEDDGVLKKSNDFRPGDTLYIRLDELSTTDKKVEDEKDDMKVYADWKVGKDAVKSIDIVYRKGEAVTTGNGAVPGSKYYTVNIGGRSLEITAKDVADKGAQQAIEDKIKAEMEKDPNFLKEARATEYKNNIKTVETGAVIGGKYVADTYTEQNGGLVADDKIYATAEEVANTIFTTEGKNLTTGLWVLTADIDANKTIMSASTTDPSDGNHTDKGTDKNNYKANGKSGEILVTLDTAAVKKSELIDRKLATEETAVVLVKSDKTFVKKDDKNYVVNEKTPAFEYDSTKYVTVDEAKDAADAAIAAHEATQLAASSRALVDVESSFDSVANPGFTYWVEIKTKDNDTTKVLDLAGVLRIGSTKNKAEKVDNQFQLDTSLDNRVYDSNNKYVVVEDEWTFEPDSRSVVKFDKDAEDVVLYFGENEAAWYEFDARGQDALNLEFTFDFNKEIADLFPKANIDFLTFTSKPATNRTGDLYITADEDTFLYEVTEDGVKEIKGAEYIEEEGAWHIRTRKLGAYAISDIELDTSVKVEGKDEASSNSSTSSKPNGDKHNPDTGR